MIIDENGKVLFVKTGPSFAIDGSLDLNDVSGPRQRLRRGVCWFAELIAFTASRNRNNGPGSSQLRLSTKVSLFRCFEWDSELLGMPVSRDGECNFLTDFVFFQGEQEFVRGSDWHIVNGGNQVAKHDIAPSSSSGGAKPGRGRFAARLHIQNEHTFQL